MPLLGLEEETKPKTSLLGLESRGWREKLPFQKQVAGFLGELEKGKTGEKVIEAVKNLARELPGFLPSFPAMATPPIVAEPLGQLAKLAEPIGKLPIFDPLRRAEEKVFDPEKGLFPFPVRPEPPSEHIKEIVKAVIGGKPIPEIALDVAKATPGIGVIPRTITEPESWVERPFPNLMDLAILFGGGRAVRGLRKPKPTEPRVVEPEVFPGLKEKIVPSEQAPPPMGMLEELLGLEKAKKKPALGEAEMKMKRELEKPVTEKPAEIPADITLSEAELKTRANEMLNNVQLIKQPSVSKGKRAFGVRVEYDPATTPTWYTRQDLGKADLVAGLKSIVKDGSKAKNKNARYVMENIEDWAKTEVEQRPAFKTVTGGDLATGDRVMIKGEWYTAKPHPKTGTIELIDDQNIKLDIFEKLPVQEIQKAKPAAKAVKEPWEMTRGEFVKEQPGIPQLAERLKDFPPEDVSFEQAYRLKTASIIDGKLYVQKPGEAGIHTVIDKRVIGDVIKDPSLYDKHRVVTGFYDPKTKQFIPQSAKSYHKELVTQAFERGEKIPPEVLAEYPELVKGKVSKVALEKKRREGKVEVIMPEEQLKGALGALWPFESKGEQLRRKLWQREKIKNEADKPSPVITMDLKPADARTFVQRPSHKYGAVPDEYGQIKANYGMAAAKAQQELMLTEIKIRADQGKGRAELANTLKQTSKENLKKYELDIIEGLENPIEVTEAKTLPLDVKQTIRDLKVLSDRQRKEIIGIKRNDIRPHFEKLAEKIYREEEGLVRKRLREGGELKPEHARAIRERVDQLVKAEVPDDWGIKDYFRHLHLGEYNLLRDGEYFGSARNWSEALTKIVDDYVENPAAKYDIKLREFLDPDVVRVSRRRQYKILNDLRKELNEESTQRIQDVLRGKIGAREAKRKWAPFMQERKGLPGYSKDLKFVLNYHNNQFHRWKNLYKLQSRIQPLIQKVRKEGRTLVAEEIEQNLQAIWGQKTKTSRSLDNFLEQKFKGRIRPFALERWVSRVKNLTTTLMLKTSLRYNLLNSMQILQTGMVVPYKSLAWAQKAVRMVEGKALLDKYGVYHVVKGTAGELTRIYTPAEVRGAKIPRTFRLSPETSNQAEMWLAVFKHGRDTLKMTEAEAANYAFLRGNVYSQFLPLKTNIPRALRPELMRAGPGMYRTFNIGAIELGTDLAKKAFGKEYRVPRQRIGNIGRLSHFVLAQLALGGTRILTGPVGKLGIGGYLTAKIYNQIKDEYGETTANVVNWGLPALINSDWSLSVQLLDAPFADNVPEAIGEVMLGPIGGTALRIGTQALANDGEEESRLWRIVNATAQKFGGTRQLLGLEKVLTGDYDFRSPNGKLQFEGDLKDALVQMYGSRPLKSAIQSMNFDALTEVWEQRNDAINSAVRLMNSLRKERGAKFLKENDRQAIEERYAQFNTEWPDLAITYADVRRRADGRDKIADLSAFERALKTKGKPFQELFGVSP